MDAVSFTLFSPRYLTSTLHIYPGGYCGFQVTGIIEWGQKSKPTIWPFVQYFICRTVQLGYTGTTTNLRIVLSTPQKIPTLIKPPRRSTCQIFLPHKNPGIKNFEPPKILWSSPSFEIWSALHGYIYNSASAGN